MSRWLPTSSCQASCADDPNRPTVSPWIALIRLARCAVVISRGSSAFARARFFAPANRQRLARRWACLMLASLGVRLDVHSWTPGERRPVGALYVSNHISWLDNLALLATFRLPAVARREVADWPVVGGFAKHVGTIFIDRERLRALPADVARVSAVLASGSGVLVSPEGTTWCGARMGRFRPAMFQAAIDARADVVPVAIRYRTEDGRPTSAAAFVGDDTLLTSLRRVVTTSGLVLEIHVLPVLPAGTSSDRRALALLAEYSIAACTDAEARTLRCSLPTAAIARSRAVGRPL